MWRSPAGISDDIFLLETTRTLNTYIITNDLFKEYYTHYSEIYNRRLPFMFIHDQFILPLEYKGPSSD
ncbi:MAG: NYN domain-containing protein [Candidatus Hodarchaeales archaeon]